MVDNSAVENNVGVVVSGAENKAQQFVDSELLNPHRAFGKYVDFLLPHDATALERIVGIQVASTKFNQVASDERKICLLYHFTDTKGATGISEQGLIGKTGDKRIYLTTLTPDVAQPLASAEDAKGFEMYFKEHKIPQTIKEHTKKLILAMKFKWRHDIQKRLLHRPIVPVGADKLENVVIVAIEGDSTVLKKDAQGEIYVERPILIQSDPNFQVFGPFPTPS